MKIKLCIVSLCFMVSMFSYAESAKRETVNELFKLMQVQKTMDAVYAQTDAIFKQAIQKMKIEDSQKPVVEKFAAKYSALIKTEISWEKLKEPMMDAYANVYTEKELKAIIQFYQSPTGQKMLAKMPELMKASMGMVQHEMQALMPKLMELQKELEAELQASVSKSS